MTSSVNLFNKKEVCRVGINLTSYSDELPETLNFGERGKERERKGRRERFLEAPNGLFWSHLLSLTP